jgi:hypothetical protein
MKRGDFFVQIDADESRLFFLARTRDGCAFGLGSGFWLSFDRAHGDKLHEAFSQGLAPLCEKHVKVAGGPNRHLPLRARSSTGLVVRALRYNGGLAAHTCNRAALRRSAPGEGLVLVEEENGET